MPNTYHYFHAWLLIFIFMEPTIILKILVCIKTGNNRNKWLTIVVRITIRRRGRCDELAELLGRIVGVEGWGSGEPPPVVFALSCDETLKKVVNKNSENDFLRVIVNLTRSFRKKQFLFCIIFLSLFICLKFQRLNYFV